MTALGRCVGGAGLVGDAGLCVLAFLFAIVAPGCDESGDSPRTIAELRDVATNALKAAQRDPGAAGEAADRAEEAAGAAAQLLEAKTDAVEADRVACSEATTAAQAARQIARIVEEERRLEEITSSWTARAYRSGRGAVLSAVFAALAYAAEQASSTELEQLSEPVRESARLAEELAGRYAGRQPSPNGETDWKAVAADVRNLRAKPPVDLHLVMAVGLLCSARNGLALVEIESLDAAHLPPDIGTDGLRLLRGVILSRNGLRSLALREVEAIEEAAGTGPEMLAGAHLVLACLYLEERNYRNADLEIVRSMQVWPGNPIGVFLTGERLAATGEYEKAADTLEDLAKGSGAEHLAERLMERARRLRDSPGEAEPLLTDSMFMRDVVLFHLWTVAKESAAAEQVRRVFSMAEQFGRELVRHLPGSGAAATQPAGS